MTKDSQLLNTNNKNITDGSLHILEIIQQIKEMDDQIEQQAQEYQFVQYKLGQIQTELRILSELTSHEATKKDLQTLQHELDNHHKAVYELARQVHEIESQQMVMKNRLSWRAMEYFWRVRSKLVPYNSRQNEILVSALLRVGALAESKPTKKYTTVLEQKGEPVLSPYQEWISQFEEKLDPKTYEDLAKTFNYRPLISIVTPVYNTPVGVLRETVESILGQYYDRWEWCVCEASSESKQVKILLDEYSQRDARIRVKSIDSNLGISQNTNQALKMAQGEFIALLDHDDLLAPSALFEIVKLLNQEPNADIIYSDEDRITPAGERYLPFFKPDWSPDLLTCFMYVGHLTVYRKTLVDKLKGFRAEYDFSQDYDLILRATELTTAIHHIPKILYHWRSIPGSAAAGDKDFARQANLAALADAASRRGWDSKVVEYPSANRLKFMLNTYPLISIIIPTDSRTNALSCLESIIQKTSYPNYEVLVVTNSDLADALVQYYQNNSRVKAINYDAPFNFSAKCNLGVERANGEYVLFLNDDVQPLQEDWLEPMLEHTQRPEIGAVSPKLLYEDGTIQHAGLVTGVRNLVGTAFHISSSDSGEYFNFIQSVRNVSALSGACLMMSKKDFERVNGYDEVNTPIANSDFDLCFKLREIGLLLIYTPFSVLKHVGHVSLREVEEQLKPFDKSAIYMIGRWGEFTSYDPYYPDNMRNFLYYDSPAPYKMYAQNEQDFTLAPVNILLVSHLLNLSGAPIMMFYIAKYLKEIGYWVTVAAPTDGDLIDMYRSSGIPLIIDTEILENSNTLQNLASPFDIVLVNTIVAWSAIPMLHKIRKPCIWMVHESNWGVEEVESNPDIKLAFGLADAIVFPANSTLQLYKNIQAREKRAIHYGLPNIADTSTSLDLSNSEKVVAVVVGSIEPRKGQDILAKSMLLLAPEVLEKLDVYCIGKVLIETFFEDLQRLAEPLDNLHFVDEIPHQDVLSYISAADILICPSRDETGPIVVMEAMAYGKCVITTRVGSVAEIIEHSQDGILVDVDDASALAEGIKQIVTHPEQLNSLGKAARIKFEEYITIERYGEELATLIKRTLTKNDYMKEATEMNPVQDASIRSHQSY